MRKFQRILFLVGLLFLLFFTLRHVYMRFFQPTASVLDRFERPMKDKITTARSLQDLVALYEEAQNRVKAYEAEVKKLRTQARDSGQPLSRYDEVNVPGYEQDPHIEQEEIAEAIREWEHKQKQSGEIYFYWLLGLLLIVAGFIVYRKHSLWLGTGLCIGGFSEMIYWSSPTFFGAGVVESSRLLTQKTIFSLATLVILILAAELVGILKNNDAPVDRR